MKQIASILFLLLCTTAVSQVKKSYVLDIEKSKIIWTGEYAFSFSEHTGTVNFKQGVLATVDGNISGGTFVIDMTSITNPDHLEGNGPVDHLKDPDFFNVAKFPEASIVFTSVKYSANSDGHHVIADLTIKGITKSVKFWATADESENAVYTKFKIDRTLWGISYNNKLKEHAIADGIGFEVSLVFKANNL